METTPFLVARSLPELHEAMKLVPRQTNCVKCDDQSKLQCPSCPQNQVCQFTVPLDCTQCPKSICIDDESPSNNSGGGGNGPSAGPIAGGVIGGIAAIAIITYLVWRFLIKPKRRLSQEVYGPEEHVPQDAEKDGPAQMGRRGSTHTVHSIASTVLTRASNIIQIAYIPGVTNRATPTSPAVLVPPVPPIPMHHTEGHRESTLTTDDPHFFVPGNLRDSTYSGISGYSDRTSYARTSFAPRSSIASTIYGKQAQVLAPAQTGMRAKPTMVSVKAGANNLSAPNTPPVPSIDFEKFNNNQRPQSTASTFSVGSTFLNNANTATQARAQVVKVGGSGLKKVEIAYKSEANSSSTTLGLKPAQSPSPAPTVTRGSTATDQGPFSDPPSNRNTQSTLAASVKESAKEGASKSSVAGARGTSPFGDEHATN